MTNTQLKTQIDTDITNKTLSKSISPLNVGKNIKDVIDYINQEISNSSNELKTAGVITATTDLIYPILSYDFNTVDCSQISTNVVLPTTTVIGKEIVVFAANNSSSFSVKADQLNSSKISSGGVSSTSSSLSVGANISVRFIHIGNGYWKAEII